MHIFRSFLHILPYTHWRNDTDQQDRHNTFFQNNSIYDIYIYYDKFCTEILSHDGTINYMNNNLDMKGQSISNTSQLSAITYVYTPTLRATNIDLSDVSSSGATDLTIIRLNFFHGIKCQEWHIY